MSVTKVGDPRNEAILRKVAKLTDLRLLVGVPGEAMHTGSKIDKSVIAYINELGDDELHIPARPFLVPGITEAMPTIAKLLPPPVTAFEEGAPDSDLAIGFTKAGLMAVVAVQKKMTDGPFTPLAKRTLQARARRGVTRVNPLIDTGELRNAVTYAITTKDQI